MFMIFSFVRKHTLRPHSVFWSSRKSFIHFRETSNGRLVLGFMALTECDILECACLYFLEVGGVRYWYFLLLL